MLAEGGQRSSWKGGPFVAKLRHRYNLTLEQYQELENKQGGRCAICGQTTDILCVDHDHACCPGYKSCGECIRGLLCQACNKAIAFLKDDPAVALSAADYLRGWEDAG